MQKERDKDNQRKFSFHFIYKYISTTNLFRFMCSMFTSNSLICNHGVQTTIYHLLMYNQRFAVMHLYTY